MEPLHPSDREALKRAHPGLTDDEIDQAEELIAQSERLEDSGRATEAEVLRAELSAFTRERIPRYREVMSEAAAGRAERMRQRGVPPRVVRKPR